MTIRCIVSHLKKYWNEKISWVGTNLYVKQDLTF